MSNTNHTAMIKAFVTPAQKNAFKAACALEGRTMNDVLEELISSYAVQVHGKRSFSPQEVQNSAA